MADFFEGIATAINNFLAVPGNIATGTIGAFSGIGTTFNNLAAVPGNILEGIGEFAEETQQMMMIGLIGIGAIILLKK